MRRVSCQRISLAHRRFRGFLRRAACLNIGVCSISHEHQRLIVDVGALNHLVALLNVHMKGVSSRAVSGIIRRAADAITNLAQENAVIKIRARNEGGIPPLVEQLEYLDMKVQRAAAGALRTLAFKNDENKRQIVDCGALPILILMLRSEDTAIHYEAGGVIGNLVHSSPGIKREVLHAGALQPVIGLPNSCCPETQREAALLLGQFAAPDSDCKGYFRKGCILEAMERYDDSEKYGFGNVKRRQTLINMLQL